MTDGLMTVTYTVPAWVTNDQAKYNITIVGKSEAGIWGPVGSATGIYVAITVR